MSRSILVVAASLVVALAAHLIFHRYTSDRAVDGPGPQAVPVAEAVSTAGTIGGGQGAARSASQSDVDCASVGVLGSANGVEVMVAAVNGQRARSFDWSPDCSGIVVAAGSQILVMSPDGRGLRPLADATLHGWDPDWSPDGTRIAFTNRSEIHVIDADGTDARQLTDASINEDVTTKYRHRSVDPEWSPDGTRIAFTSNRDGDDEIYTMAPDGSDVRQLTENTDPRPDHDWPPQVARIVETDRDPEWSPDGTRIAFTSNRDGDDEIYTMAPDGSDVRQLTENDALDWDPEWSPDGTRIAFTSNRDGDDEIYTMAPDGSDVRQLTDGGTGGWAPSWSPDGSHIIFSTMQGAIRQYAAVRADDPSAQQISEQPPEQPFEQAPLTDHDDYDCSKLNGRFAGDSSGQATAAVERLAYEHGWSPDCTRVVLVGGQEWGYGILSVSLDGRNIRHLTNDNHWYANPVWSPDGTRIAFESNRDGSYEIHIMDADGTDVFQLTNLTHRQRNPAWSPDGTRIAFQRGGSGADIWVITTDGRGDLQKITHNDDYYHGNPVWSPDGTRIAFTSNRDGDDEIYTMAPDGADIVQITGNDADEWGPVWSPDGTRIAFTSNRDGDDEIYTMAPDGADIVQITGNDADEWGPVWSPDGTRIAFTSNRDGARRLYVADTTTVGR